MFMGSEKKASECAPPSRDAGKLHAAEGRAQIA